MTSTSLQILLPLALGASVVALWGLATRRLAFAMVVLGLAIEENFSAGYSTEDGAALAPSWMQIGHPLWLRPPGFPSLAVVVAIAATAGALFFGRRVISPGGRRLWLLLALLVVWTMTVSLANGLGLGAATRQSSPWLLMLGGSAAARAVRHLPGDRQVLSAISALLVVKVVTALALLRTTVLVPFFDATVPMAAGVVLVALVFRPPRGVRPRSVWLCGALCVLVMLLSERRTPIVVTVLLAALMVGMSRPRVALRALSLGLVAASVLPIVAPGPTSRVTTGVNTLLGADDDESTEGHISDLRVGAAAVIEHPLNGVGPSAAQLDGAANTGSETLYLHNEYLQIWLRFGLPAVVLLVGVVLGGARRSLRLVRHSQAFVTNLAAVACLAVPLCMLLFPPLTGTQRWALLYGASLGLVHSIRPRTSRRVDASTLTATFST